VPRLLCDLSVGLLAREGSVEVLASDLELEEVPNAVAAGRVEVLVAGARLADPTDICRLLADHPRLKALVVSDEGRRAVFYEVRPNLTTQELSPETLADVVRAVRRDAEERGDG
jgi:hypothetical protein